MQVLEGVLGGSGSFLSVVAWAAGTAGAVPISQYVMAVGTLLVLASIGVAVWGMFDSSAESFVYGILDVLEDEQSYTQRADLGSTVELLRELMDATHFAPLDEMFRVDLEARGFSAELAEGLTS